MPRRGYHMTDEHKAKMSTAHMGLKASPEVCAKMSASHKGVPLSIETRARMSAANKGNLPWNTGITMTDKQKEKFSAAKMGHIVSPETGAKISSAKMGHSVSPETREKIRVGNYKGGARASRAKRRTLGFNQLNSPFPGCEAHHINKDDVIHIPVILHKSVWHNVWTGLNIDKINTLAYEWLAKESNNELPRMSQSLTGTYMYVWLCEDGTHVLGFGSQRRESDPLQSRGRRNPCRHGTRLVSACTSESRLKGLTMRQNIQELVDAGYVGELFPLVFVSPVYDPTWVSILCHCCGHDHQVCSDRVAGICRHHVYRKPCLYSECNLWRWFNFEVLQGIHNWVLT